MVFAVCLGLTCVVLWVGFVIVACLFGWWCRVVSEVVAGCVLDCFCGLLLLGFCSLG